MERNELVERLCEMLLKEMPQYEDFARQYGDDSVSRRRLLRALMNMRPPMELDLEYIKLQDELLSAEREERGVVDITSIPTGSDPRIALWQGDITRLKADAIVNAANSELLGCFAPEHACIDNCIHSAAGLQLRDECSKIMTAQKHLEPTGRAQITRGYDLPCLYVLHTVGPVVSGSVTDKDRELLASCYRSCLSLASDYMLESVVFCCISTGVFHFPNDEAAKIAVSTVKECLDGGSNVKKVVFNVFKDIDLELYSRLLK